MSTGDDTTKLLHLARRGDITHLAAVFERFEPLLHASASYHLSRTGRRLCEPDDLTMEVWAIVLRRLPELEFERGLSARSFMAFLVSTLRNLLNNLMRRHLRDGVLRETSFSSATGDAFDHLPASITGITTRQRIKEVRDAFAAALDQLEDNDRELIILRGIEQVPNKDAALLLGVPPGTLAVRYHRALDRLKDALPERLLDEIENGP